MTTEKNMIELGSLLPNPPPPLSAHQPNPPPPLSHQPTPPPPPPQRNAFLWSIPAYIEPLDAPPPPAPTPTPAPPTKTNNQSNKMTTTTTTTTISTPLPRRKQTTAPANAFPAPLPTTAPDPPWTKTQYLSLAQTAEENFPFTSFASEHSLSKNSVMQVFSALVQLPAIRAANNNPCTTTTTNRQDIISARIHQYQKATASTKKLHEKEMREFLKVEIRHGVRAAKEREKRRKEKRKAKAAALRELDGTASSSSSQPRKKKLKGRAGGILAEAIAVQDY